jgi:uncharacterized protein (TIGR02271 family)
MALGLTVDRLLEMRGKPVYDKTGEKIGSIEDIYIDDESREPEWIGLGTGFLGMKHAIVPLAQASIKDEGIAVPYDKDMVKGAPDIADDEDTSADQESELTHYYGIETSTSYAGTQASGTTAPPASVTPTTMSGTQNTASASEGAGAGTHPMSTTPGAADFAGTHEGRAPETLPPASGKTIEAAARTMSPMTPEGAAGPAATVESEAARRPSESLGGERTTVTRSEEEMRVGKREVPAGRVTLHKYVETQPVSQDVELKRETARVERKPVDRPLASGEELGEDSISVPLTEEEAVIEKTARAKEEFAVDKDAETRHETVTGEVRKERVDVEGEDGDDLNRR